MLTLNDGRSELWQWDTGRTLAVDADCSQVHFSNKVFGRSIDVDVVNGAAIIPDVLLQTDKDLNVWAFVGTAENGYTKISKTFAVNRRNKPADYVFTPTDQMTLQTIQSQIGDLADLTTEAKDTLVAAINEAARSGGAGSMDLRVADGYVQYSTDGGSTWQNLIAVAELKGADGSTPHIGDNGNWYLGAEDTGKPSRGETGPKGLPGIYYGTTQPTGDTHPVWIDPDGGPDDGGLLPAVTVADNGKVLRVVSSAWSAEDMPTGGTDMGITGATAGQIAKITAVDASGAPTAWSPVNMPDKLPNPNALTFTGAVTGIYDGSAPVSVEIPSGVGSGSDISLGLTGATVGQIAKITAVDDTGKPTAWAPVDMPSGGGSEEMRVIKTITITAADVNSIYFNRDDNGLPFELTKHIRIRMYGAATNTGSTQAALFFRAGQTIGDASQARYPIKVNSNNVNYIFDFVWDLYSAVNCWYGDCAYARSGATGLQRFVPSEGNNSSDITVREIKLLWSNADVFFQQGATIVVEGI